MFLIKCQWEKEWFLLFLPRPNDARSHFTVFSGPAVGRTTGLSIATINESTEDYGNSESQSAVVRTYSLRVSVAECGSARCHEK